ncbi:delta fatty acid desaturase [Phanerochaete sordida]|uniref:Delta fatty acid desaturase n=1 Tax=Phanerochaete sordida TaxID=48140 RepID=A0A9P3GQ41_9APHY|nr:delta fatty acid desaturase [Phanerochaete sordida]
MGVDSRHICTASGVADAAAPSDCSSKVAARPASHPTAPVAEDEVAETAGFKPFDWTMDDVRKAVPAHLFVRSTARAMSYLARDVAMAVALWISALRIDSICAYARETRVFPFDNAWGPLILKCSLWLVYWWFQGLVFMGLWVIGHECGHGGFSDHQWISDVVGYAIHTSMFTPYFSWKISHHRHHMNHASMENDEVYVPHTRSEYKIPEPSDDGPNYDEYLGDAPVYTLFKMVLMQLFAYPAYLIYNTSGQREYPEWTSHFNPNSVLFKETQRTAVVVSDIGVAAALWAFWMACQKWGTLTVAMYYGVPWFCVNHWLVLLTYLHHTDPVLPHYRANVWTFARGAAATMDRDFLGWHGRFFLHGISHYHVAHHFFPKMPFYNGAAATEHLKAFLGEHYFYSDKPVFRALWDNYNECQFVEDTGDIVFYRNREGKSVREPA